MMPRNDGEQWKASDGGGGICVWEVCASVVQTHTEAQTSASETVEVKGNLNLAHLCRIVRVPSKQHHVFERE